MVGFALRVMAAVESSKIVLVIVIVTVIVLSSL